MWALFWGGGNLLKLDIAVMTANLLNLLNIIDGCHFTKKSFMSELYLNLYILYDI